MREAWERDVTHAIVVSEFGGHEVLSSAEVERPSPGPTDVLVSVTISGVNFLDVYQRTGVTPLRVPFIAGVEGVGVIAEIGSAVSDLVVGQRVGWLTQIATLRGGRVIGTASTDTKAEAARAAGAEIAVNL